MSALLDDLKLRITSPYGRTAEVNPYDLAEPMRCVYEYVEGESPLGGDIGHPGSPPIVELLECWVGEVDVMPMLSNSQMERIGDALERLHL